MAAQLVDLEGGKEVMAGLGCSLAMAVGIAPGSDAIGIVKRRPATWPLGGCFRKSGLCLVGSHQKEKNQRSKRVLIIIVVLLALAAIPSVSGAGGPPGCLKGGKKFVGDVGLLASAYAGIFASINWTYPSSACTGGIYYAEGDSSVQIWKFPDGSWAHYVYVFTAKDLSGKGAVCEWDTVTDEEPCGDVTNSNLKYWLIHFNSNAEKFKATPAGRGFY